MTKAVQLISRTKLKQMLLMIRTVRLKSRSIKKIETVRKEREKIGQQILKGNKSRLMRIRDKTSKRHHQQVRLRIQNQEKEEIVIEKTEKSRRRKRNFLNRMRIEHKRTEKNIDKIDKTDKMEKKVVNHAL